MKTGRNDPCPCGSGKKFKQCCMTLPHATGKKKFKATVISSGSVPKPQQPAEQKPIFPDLIERTYGNVIKSIKEEEIKTEVDNETT